MPIYQSQSEEETIHIAANLAREARNGDIFTLSGTLGAGKSVFARAFIQTLMGADVDVPSPTFTLVQTYEAPAFPLWHFDLYRLQDPEEIFEIGWEDAQAGGIMLVEWAEKAGPYLPRKSRPITITVTGDNSRTIEIDE